MSDNTRWTRWGRKIGEVHASGGYQAVTHPVTGAQAQVSVPPGWIKFRAEDNPNLAVLVELGERAPNMDQGSTTWEERERPGDVSVTRFVGKSPGRYEFDIVFDGLNDVWDVKPALDVMDALRGRGPRATRGTPPRVRVEQGRPWPASYVIADLAFSDDPDETVVDAGRILLATASITLLQHIDDTRLEDRALQMRLKLQARQRTRGANRVHTVKEGETLFTIARDHLGDAGRWEDLAEINGLRDPRKIRRGARIKLP